MDLLQALITDHGRELAEVLLFVVGWRIKSPIAKKDGGQ